MKIKDLVGDGNEKNNDFVFVIDGIDCSQDEGTEQPEPSSLNSDYVRIGFGSKSTRRTLTDEEVKEEIKTYAHEIKDGYLYLQCICDGTYYFLYRMMCLLAAVGCTDIQQSDWTGEIDGVLRSVFTVRGIVPDGFAL